MSLELTASGAACGAWSEAASEGLAWSEAHGWLARHIIDFLTCDEFGLRPRQFC